MWFWFLKFCYDYWLQETWAHTKIICSHLSQKTFPRHEIAYDNALEKLYMLTLQNRLCQFDALFLLNVFSCPKRWPSAFETVGLRVPTRNIRNLNTFPRFFLATVLQLDRCVSTASAVWNLKRYFQRLWLECQKTNLMHLIFIFVDRVH
jgi:hypothetical protein